jgi:hypothetical protein
LCFDASAEGEQLRRYQLAGQRALLRTVDALLKLRRAEPLEPIGNAAASPPATGALGDSLTATITCGPEGVCSCIATDLLPAVPDPSAGPPTAAVPEPDVQNLRNEPSNGGDDRPGGAEPSPAVLGEDPISKNEPTDPAGEPGLVAVQPEIAAADAGPQPEPACGRCSDSPPVELVHALGAALEVGTDPALAPARSAPAEDSFHQASGPLGPQPLQVLDDVGMLGGAVGRFRRVVKEVDQE